MTDQEILQKALDKAIKNGYTDWGMPRGFAVYSVIFSHDFAKAFWGEKNLWVRSCGHADASRKDAGGWPLDTHSCPDYDEGGHAEDVTAWRFHLQQMVLEENPIQYLEKYL